MENNKNSYVKTDNNRIINENHIRWIEKMGDCLEVCVKSTGCVSMIGTHKICKLNNPDCYNKLVKYFE